jgi:hypothetical protein
MPPRNPETGRPTDHRGPRHPFEQPPELDDEDEAALDRAWAKIAREDAERARRQRRMKPPDSSS